jgi:hypothetical protein
MEHEGKQQEVAKAYEQHHQEDIDSLMPYAPSLHAFLYRHGHQISVNHTAYERYAPEQQ